MGESIRFEVETQTEAESLGQTLRDFAPVVRRERTWLVEITPGRDTTPLLLRIFQTLGDWLVASNRASLHIHFGDRSFTLFRSSEARPYHAAEFLLERVIQLETALESRVVIEQAKGILAARLRLAVEEAFELLRRAARTTGRQLHELAQEVVESEEIPEQVRHVLGRRRSSGERGPEDERGPAC